MDERSIDELFSITQAIIAYDLVTIEDANFLMHWMEANVPCCEDQMVNQIYRRVHEMLIDKVLQDDEKAELMQLLRNSQRPRKLPIQCITRLSVKE